MVRFIIIFSLFLLVGIAQAAEVSKPFQQADATAKSKSTPDGTDNLLAYALSNEGAPYRKGGNNPDTGFDCSGFVRYVFRNVEGVALPHGSDVLSKIGQHIETTNLLPGDLVFFRILHHAISHVGIYLGKGEFIHASSSKTGSVIVSSLSESYWSKHFTLARRIELSPKQVADQLSDKAHPG